MATVDIDLRLNQGNLRQGFRQVERSISQTNGVLNSFIGNLAATAFQAFATGAVTAFGDIFRSAIQIEQVSAQFRVLTGSADVARVALENVSQFAAGTPFDNPSVERAATQLLAFGTTAGQLTERLTDLGNIAGVANASIDEIATIFGQVNAQGRLTAERFNQLAERGVNLGNELASGLGIPVSQVRDAIMRGAISADVFNTAIGQLGDRFMGISALTMTLGGALSTLGSQFELLRRNIGTELVPILTELTNGFAMFLASIQPTVRAISQLVVERVVMFFRELIQQFRDGEGAISAFITVLRENRGIIIRLAAIYAVYISVLAAARVATIAFSVVTFALGPLLNIVRGGFALIAGIVPALTTAYTVLSGVITTRLLPALAGISLPLVAAIATFTAATVAGAAFSDRIAVFLIQAQRAFVRFGIAVTGVLADTETVFRGFAVAIVGIITPAFDRLRMLVLGFIDRIPAAFRPDAVNRFADSLRRVDLNRFAGDLATSSSGIRETNQRLQRFDRTLGQVQASLEEQADMANPFENIRNRFSEIITGIRDSANENVVGPLLNQFNMLTMGLDSITPESLRGFTESAGSLITGLRQAIVNGMIPEAFTNVLNNIQMQIDEREARLRRQARDRENFLGGTGATGTTGGATETQGPTPEQQRALDQAARHQTALNNLEVMGTEARALLAENEALNIFSGRTNLNEMEITQVREAEDRIALLRFNFGMMRAEQETNANRRELLETRNRETLKTSIERNAANERMRIQAAELRTRQGYGRALDQLIQAGLNSERLGANERKALLVTQAIINTYAGATRAFADYPYPASAAVAAATIAAGLVQVDNIVNAGSFQQGGIVGGNSFSGDRLTANVNSGELILNRAQQSNLAGQIREGESLERSMDERLARIEQALLRPTVIQNANGQMFAELTREGVRDGIELNG